MSGKSVKMTLGPHSSRAEIAAYINHALVVSDITGICQAIGDATRLHDMSDIAQKSGIERPSIYRAFSGKRYPNFTTVLNVLGAMGLQMKVSPRRGHRAKLSRLSRTGSSKRLRRNKGAGTVG